MIGLQGRAPIALALLAALAIGCDDGNGGGSDTGQTPDDMLIDGAGGEPGDMTPDPEPDAAPDAIVDAMPDAAVDAIVDVMPDAIVDAMPDAAPDAAPDMLVDQGPPPCNADGDCADGEICGAESICVAAPECAVDFDCAEGRICLDGFCRGVTGCDDESPCPGDRPCVEGVCAQQTCADDDVCGPDALCMEGVCVAGGCRGDADCADDAYCAPEGLCRPAPPCLVDFDCADEWLCLEGLCRAPAACGEDAPCPADRPCVDGICAQQTCAEDPSCGDGSLCLEGLCVAADCRDAFDCDPGLRCLRNRCIDGDCLDDDDCGPSGLCFDNRCGPGDCRVDEQCAAGSLCLTNICTPADCRADADCGDGVLCLDTLCIPGDCREDADCGEGSLCEANQCVPGDCRDDAACGEGQLCLELSCTDADCRGDAECAPGQLCLANLCTAADCREDAECADGESCVRNTCIVGDCLDGLDCGPEQTCIRNSCIDGDCLLDGDCGDGELCLDQQCTVADCRADGDCDAGSLCFDNQCTEADCRVTGDCAEAQTCIRNACIDGDCLLDGDCGEGELCLDQQCTVADCRIEADCAPGEACIRNTCILGDCIEDFDCDEGVLCLANTCTPNGCRVDDDCDFGSLCFDQMCEEAECRDDAGCRAGQLCLDRSCISGDCRIDDECGDGELCLENNCTEADCRENVDCADGENCIRNSCIDGDCLDDGDCEAGALCLGNSCTPGDCRGDAECGDGELCLENFCTEADCRADGECAADQLCLGNQCLRADCRVDGDCAAGELCQANLCVPDPALASCRAALEFPANGVLQGDLRGLDALQQGSCGGAGPERVYTRVQGAAVQCLRLVDADGPITLHARTDCGDGATEGACIDAPPVGTGLTLDAEEGATWFIFVDSPEDRAGRFTLSTQPGACPAVCAADAECAAGRLCLDRLCRPAPACDVDDDCVDGRICEAGRCAPPQCADDPDCPDAQLCIDQRCVVADCRVDEDCAEGLCFDNTCQLGRCRADEDCPVGLCLETVCVENGCRADEDCDVGLCLDNRCEPNGCRADEDCAEGLCIANRCEPNGCRADEDCAVGLCLGNQCIENGCRGDADCEAGNVCSGQTCQPGCRLDEQCPEGALCLGDVCVEGGCRGDLDCGDGELCIDGLCAVADCRADADCVDGICEANLCAAPQCGVEGLDPCPEDQVCADNRCVEFVQTFGTCDLPWELVVGERAIHTLDDAPAEIQGGCGGDGPESFYRLVAPAAGNYCIYIEQASFDTTLSVRSTCLDGESELTCNDDGDFAGGLLSDVTVFLDPEGGEGPAEVSVIVENLGGAEGPQTYTLLVRPGACGEPQPCEADAECVVEGEVCFEGSCQVVECRENADCGGETPICRNNICIPDVTIGTCEAPTEVIVGQTIRGTTAFSDSIYEASCASSSRSPEQVHIFTPPATSGYCATTIGSEYDTSLYARAACADQESEIICNDDFQGLQSGISFQGEAGVPLFLFVDGFSSGNSGPYVLDVTRGNCGELPPCEVQEDCIEGELCIGGSCVVPECLEAGDCETPEGEDPYLCREFRCVPDEPIGDCDAPLPIGLDEPVAGRTTFGDSEQLTNCGSGQALPEQVYAVVPQRDGPHCAELLQADFRAAVGVRSVCADPESGLNCQVSGEGPPAVTFDAVAGDTYAILVEGRFQGDDGNYTLQVRRGACGLPPPCDFDADCEAGELCFETQCEPDPCAAPAVIDGPGVYQANSQGALPLQTASCGLGLDGPEVVFAMTRDVDGPVCLSTLGTGFDTVLSVRAAVCDDLLSEVACNDDDDTVGRRQSRLTLDATADTPYFVYVDGYQGATGQILLEMTEGPCDFEADICHADADCPEGTRCIDKACVEAPDLGGCEEPIPIEDFGTIQGNTRETGQAVFGAVCGGGATSVEDVYVFTPQASGPVCFNLDGTLFDSVLHVRAGDCASTGAQVACNDDAPPGIAAGVASAITLEATAGTDYYVFVDGFGFARGDYVLDVSPGPCRPPCEENADCGLGESCVAGGCAVACDVDGDCPAGEACVSGGCEVAVPSGTCEAPIVLENPVGVHTASTAGAAAVLEPVCSDAPSGAEAVFAFTAEADVELCVTTQGSGFDTVLTVQSDPCGGDRFIGCNDDSDQQQGSPFNSAVNLAARAGQTYYAIVDGVGGGGGRVTLDIREGKCRRPSFSGIRRDIPEAEILELGFELCWSGLYGRSEPLAPILNQRCNQNVLVWACRPVGNDNLTLAAMGERGVILTDLGRDRGATINHNGLDWYYSDNYSMGFVAEGTGVSRNSCDTAGNDREFRMCWHTSGGNINSGYRCGTTTLNGNNSWERLIFQRSGGL